MQTVLDEAIQRLLKADLHLFRVDASERAIAHRLACHLDALVDDLDVDCEYNRDKRAVKILESHGWNGRNVAPDIVLHKRGTDENLLVIEVKKASQPEAEKDSDRLKVRAFVEDLGYSSGAFVVFRTGKSDAQLEEIDWVESDLDRHPHSDARQR